MTRGDLTVLVSPRVRLTVTPSDVKPRASMEVDIWTSCWCGRPLCLCFGIVNGVGCLRRLLSSSNGHLFLLMYVSVANQKRLRRALLSFLGFRHPG
jgi:hypothetical protein